MDMHTRPEVEQAARQLRNERWTVWMQCGAHDWQALPVTMTGEHFCGNCCTLWTSRDGILNEPFNPGVASPVANTSHPGRQPDNSDSQSRHDHFVSSDGVTGLEDRFPLKELLALDYFVRQRRGYYRCQEEGWQRPLRNYYNLLEFLADIHEYRCDDAKAFSKAFRTGAADWRNSEAVFAEVIVYRYYVRLVYEGIIRSVRLGREECDVIVDRLDGSTAFLEVFCIQPQLREPNAGEVVLNKIQTHTQDAMASVPIADGRLQSSD